MSCPTLGHAPLCAWRGVLRKRRKMIFLLIATNQPGVNSKSWLTLPRGLLAGGEDYSFRLTVENFMRRNATTVHTVALALEVVPGRHATGFVARATQWLPAGHTVHSTAPPSLYQPAEHSAGAWSGVWQNMPGGHSTQLMAPTSAPSTVPYWPGKHGTAGFDESAQA